MFSRSREAGLPCAHPDAGASSPLFKVSGRRGMEGRYRENGSIVSSGSGFERRELKKRTVLKVTRTSRTAQTEPDSTYLADSAGRGFRLAVRFGA